MKVLYIGESQTYKKYCVGIVPSHWLYGACEMAKDGHEVIWENEKKFWFHDICLVNKHKPDIVFIPNLNLRNHMLFLVFVAVGLYKKPIYAYLHHTPNIASRIKRILYRFLFKGPKHLFFLSELTMHEVILKGLVPKQKCSVPGWGPDIDFYSKIKTSDNEYFISTGKENRDFDILIEAFRRTGASLKIMTSSSHGNNNYEYLISKCKDIPNIEVEISENTGDVYPKMLAAMANAKAIVCPLLLDKLNYCVGLSTITDAEGLRKPLIITRNPYHDKERIANFYQVESTEDWEQSIKRILQDGENCSVSAGNYSIKKAYDNMKKVIFQ